MISTIASDTYSKSSTRTGLTPSCFLTASMLLEHHYKTVGDLLMVHYDHAVDLCAIRGFCSQVTNAYMA